MMHTSRSKTEFNETEKSKIVVQATNMTSLEQGYFIY